MECKQIITRLNRYTDGECDAETASLVRAHLTGCAECRAELNTLTGLDRSIKRLAQVAPGPAFTGMIMQKIQRRRRIPVPVQSLAYALLFLFAFSVTLLLSPARTSSDSASGSGSSTVTGMLLQSQELTLLSSHRSTMRLLEKGKDR